MTANGQWRGALAAAQADAVRTLIAAAAEVDGVAPVSESVLLDLSAQRPAVTHLLVAGDDGELAGYAQLDLGDPAAGGAAELAVHPGRRRRGYGARMVQALLDRTPEPDGADGPPVRLRVWAHGDLPAARSLAGRAGFRVARELWRMRRELSDPLPDPQLPDGVRLRPFVMGADEEQFLRVNNAAFAWHPEQGGWDVEDVRRREAEPWFDPAGFLLAVDDADRVLGFHWTKVHPDGPGGAGGDPVGEVYVLGVDPAVRGLRLGAALTLAGLAHLRAVGPQQVMLYAEGDNAAAIRLYQALGFQRWDTDVSYVR